MDFTSPAMAGLSFPFPSTSNYTLVLLLISGSVCVHLAIPFVRFLLRSVRALLELTGFIPHGNKVKCVAEMNVSRALRVLTTFIHTM